MDVNKIHDELNEKTSEIRRLQMELSRWEDADPNDSVKNLKRVIATLEKENDNLKVSFISKCYPCKQCAMYVTEFIMLLPCWVP
jgi:hypothetical protein